MLAMLLPTTLPTDKSACPFSNNQETDGELGGAGAERNHSQPHHEGADSQRTGQSGSTSDRTTAPEHDEGHEPQKEPQKCT